MNFDFQSMKPVIAREFDRVMEHYPTDMSVVAERVPVGGDPMERKLAIVRAAVELCPVHLFDHYPYAFEIDGGGDRGYCHYGVGWLHQEKSGVDLSPVYDLAEKLRSDDLGSFSYYTDQLHRTMDYDKLMAVGFRGVYEECETYNKTEADPAKKAYRQGVMEICLLVKRLGERFKALAEKRLSDPNLDEDTIHNMTRIRDSVNTPWSPPVTLFDACNSLLCTALFMAMLDGLGMHAQGPIDRLLAPFYQADLDAGRITPAEGRFLIACFLYKTDAHAHYTEDRQSFDNGVTVMIGGCDPAGNPVYNQVTDIVIDTYLQNKLIHPKLNARAGSYSPKAYLLRLAEVIRSGNNNIIVENDDYIVPMFQRMGLSAADARTYVGVGCEEVICRNQLHSRAFIYLNMPRVLLDTLYGFRRELYRDGAFDKGDFDALYRSFLHNLRNYIVTLAETLAPFEAIHDNIKLEPMQSAFTADCMARGLDICQGGARYQHKTLSLVGFGTLVDSLLALQEAYRDGTLPELTDALAKDFRGCEVLRAKLQHSKNRFGHSPWADDFAESVAHDLSRVSRGIYNGQGIEWHTSLFTYYFFHTWRNTPATPDGRRQGEDLSRQMNMARLPELTTAAESLSRIAGAAFDDVGMLDVAIPVGQGDHYLEIMADYIKTCIDLKIPVLQPNVVDKKLLVEERDHKGTHPDLVVRICGYSALFGVLSRDMQDEVINRAEYS